MNDNLMERVLARDELADLDPARRRLALRTLALETVDDADLAPAVARLADAIDGYGPISAVMSDERVTDVLVNGPHDIWVERNGSLERTSLSFPGEQELLSFIERILGDAGARADASNPIASARLPDGSRIHVVLPPVAPLGPLVSIRRFPSTSLTMCDLVDRGLFDEAQSRALVDWVRSRRTIAISGRTGSGKTTLLNALLAEIDPSERVVLVEETPELRLTCRHCVSLVARTENVEGRGAIDLRSLVRAALRMRPDRIIVGEVRGGEAVAALAAMSTGHDGSMVTIHATSADDALERMTTLALEASTGASERSLHAQARRAFDVVVHLERRGSRRRIGHIREND